MNSRSVFILLLVAAACVGIFGAVLLYTQWYTLDKQVVEAKVEVVTGQHIGFALDKDMLNFGKVPQDGQGIRKATMQSHIPATAVIQIDGLPMLSASEYKIALEADQPIAVVFTVDVPPETPVGNYSGTVTITYFRRWA
jgi:hypothetical protein